MQHLIIFHYLELTLLFIPMIFAGVMNMIFVKISFGNSLKVPIDNGIKWFDGRPVFGSNKTWKGFLGMIIFSMLFSLLFHTLFSLGSWINSESIFYNRSPFLYGFLMGLGYVLSELPNSFIKRRINIQPGTNKSGFWGFFFVVIDQIDSVVGAGLLLTLVFPLSLLDILYLTVAGGLIHYVINILLFCMKLKKQAG